MLTPAPRFCSKLCSLEGWRGSHRDECERLQQERAARVEAAERQASELAARAPAA